MSYMREREPPLFHSWPLAFLSALGGLGYVKCKSWVLALCVGFGQVTFCKIYKAILFSCLTIGRSWTNLKEWGMTISEFSLNSESLFLNRRFGPSNKFKRSLKWRKCVDIPAVQVCAKFSTCNHLGISAIQVSLAFPLDVPFDPKTSAVTAVWVFQLRREKDVSVRGGGAPARSKEFKMIGIEGSALLHCALLAVDPIPPGIPKAKGGDEMWRRRSGKTVA